MSTSGKSGAARPQPAGVCPSCGFTNPSGFRFCGECGSALTVGGERVGAAERRQLTVLFCDLVGSTRLATTVELEELRDAVRGFQSACTDVVRRFGGTVSRYMGDGILVLFGYPQAYEDAAERAVYAGLGMVEAVARLPPPAGTTEPLAVRVGIATGLVVAGDLIGVGSAEEEAILGETPNLAGRLHAAAPPNAVVVAATTRALLGERFLCEDFGAHALKGFADPVRCWRVVRPRSVASRFASAGDAQRTPLVGREDDLAWLLGLWRAVAEHGGRVGTLRGEAGIGKSRLAEALRERLGDGCVPMRFQCSPRYDNRALHPVTQHIEQAVMIAPQDPADAKLAKLVTWLRPDDAAYRLALLATLMSVPPEVAPPLPLMTAERRKRDTFELLLTGLRERAAARPLLILFEDLHWADPTTVEFLSTLVERIDGMAALAIFTFRPDFSAPWTGPHVESRALHRLPRPPALRLVEHVAGAERIPDAVLEEVVVRADGIPLFIEELTKAVVSLGAVDERAGGQAFAIPFTLQDSLMARLDQLGSAKLVAQMASAIGREFSFSVLRAIASLPAERLRADLMTLEDAGLVHARGGVFAFKHALVQEVAYQTLLRARRQRLHSLIALVLLEQLPQQARDAPELLAHHWTEAGDAERAVAGWLAAGERACGRSEYSEAVGHLRKGLALVERLPDTAGRHAQELALLLALGPVLMMRTGAATPEVAGLYARALELCAEFPKSERHFAAQWGCWRAALDHHAGLERADKLLALAREIGDPALLVQAHHCQWPTLHVLGAHEECRRHAEEGVRLYDPERHQLHAHLYGGHDPKVCALGVGSVSCWLLGRFDESLASARLALEWAEALGHVGSRVRAMDYALEIRRLRRDVAEVARRADGMWAFATEQHLGEHAARAAFVRGWATALLGDVHRGLADMHRALESEGAAGSPSDFPLYYEMLAEVYERAGWFDRGLDAVSAGLAYAERGQLAFWNAELHRRRAELVLAAGGDPVAAAECYESALSVARDQGARFLELRAATGLARLRLRDGLSSDPMAGLRAVYAGFPRGHDVPDLRAARALLATSPSP